MPEQIDQQLVVAISSRALFDLESSHQVFVEQGVDAYWQYQIDNEDEVLEPGGAYRLVTKLLDLNTMGKPRDRVEVILLSRNSADTGLRIFNSIEHYGLPISRAAFTSGESPFRYVEPFSADLFLSNDPSDVGETLEAGYAAATILPSSTRTSPPSISFSAGSMISRSAPRIKVGPVDAGASGMLPAED